jgi:hypothetical protein
VARRPAGCAGGSPEAALRVVAVDEDVVNAAGKRRAVRDTLGQAVDGQVPDAGTGYAPRHFGLREPPPHGLQHLVVVLPVY